MRLFLLGYMGAGKTTLGLPLAKAKNIQFVDLDTYIESRYQKTISRIFEEKGESGFRKIESDILKEVSDIENVVISTGGGTPCFHDNMELMKMKGKTVYLKATPEVLASRLNVCKDKRPLIKDKNVTELLEFITEMLAKRELYYNQADIIFDTNECDTKEEIDKLIQKLISIIK